MAEATAKGAREHERKRGTRNRQNQSPSVRPRQEKAQGAQRKGREAKPGLPTRLAAATLLGAVIDKNVALDGLTDDANGHPLYLSLDGRDRTLVRAILLSALRHRSQIEAVIDHRLDRPLPEGARSLKHHLHVALAQILLLDVPDSAAVDLGVSAAERDPRAKRFKGLANALLRRIVREKAKVVDWMARHPPRPPLWLEERLIAAYGPDATEAILRAHAHEAPLDLTIRAVQGGESEAAQHWTERLGGVALPTGTVRLGRSDGPLTELNGFAEGAWWVQDAASALPVKLFGDLQGVRALDLCAAPGGKTAQMAARGAYVTAVEINANRVRRLRGNLERLELSASIVTADALELTLDDVGGEPFDAVLVDAPCSSTGTIRRHPDVAWTKTPEDVARLAALQARLLTRAADFVAPGGCLVFANCSLLPEEGERLTEAFPLLRSDFRLDPIDPKELGEGEAVRAFVRSNGTLRTTPAMLPGPEPRLEGLDGFHAARFRKDR